MWRGLGLRGLRLFCRSNLGKMIKRPDVIEKNKSLAQRKAVSRSWKNPDIREKRVLGIRKGLQKAYEEGRKNPPSRLGCKHSEETKRKISENRKGKQSGEKHWNWKGGISSQPRFCIDCGKQISSRYALRCHDCAIKIVTQTRHYRPSEEVKERIRKKLKGRKLPEEVRLKMMGRKPWNWAGGIDKKNPLRKTPEYKQWRRLVCKRDNFTCQLCGYHGKRGLEAHHIIPIKTNSNLSFDVNNGITLCKDCHQNIFGKESEHMKYFVNLRILDFSLVPTSVR